jgi:L-asparaginase II
MISVVSAGPAGSADLLACGDVNHAVWSRSCLKALQLLSHYQTIKNAYPTLSPQHLALMMSSHHAEKQHLDLLEQIMEIGGFNEELLQCPLRWPMSAEMRVKLQSEGQSEKSLYHDCSAKHFSYLLSLQSKGLPLHDYLSVDNSEHRSLEKVLSQLLERQPESFRTTTDGCQMVNYALTPRELATLYRLLSSAPDASSQIGNWPKCESSLVEQMSEILSLFRQYPVLVGGSASFDTKLMQGFVPGVSAPLIAKNGADGLLAIGVLPNSDYPSGLGILIKLSSGYEDRHMQAICTELFAQLGMFNPEHSKALAKPALGPRVRTGHLQSHFHFQVDQKVIAGVSRR